LAQLLSEYTGSNVQPIHAEDRAGDIRLSYADISKASQMLGYRPAVSVRDGLRQIADWYRREGESRTD
jgi:nucleoside-diphosphate-sugar epimerase